MKRCHCGCTDPTKDPKTGESPKGAEPRGPRDVPDPDKAEKPRAAGA